MKITLIQGSPHKQGSSNILAEQFRAGAQSAGHEVIPFDTAQAQISPCRACEYCHTKGGGACFQKDDMERLKELILSSEMLVIATPLYFFNMSAQTKTAIDRMYAFLEQMASRIKKMVLLVAANNTNPHITDCIVANYLSIVNFFGVQNAGMVLAAGCGTPELTQKSKFPELAYELGKSV